MRTRLIDSKVLGVRFHDNDCEILKEKKIKYFLESIVDITKESFY